MSGDARLRSLFRLRAALTRTRRGRFGPRWPGPTPEADGVPVESPRTPTLLGGAAVQPGEEGTLA